MKKHVVFMVHGVGEQVPGETIDEFVGGVCEELDLGGPVQNNTLLLANAEATDDNLLDLFPCHQRRVANPEQDEELVVAEVHWADISPAPSGVVGTAIDLLRLVLGLGYIALDNVQNNVVSGNAYVQRLVPLFIWVFYAIIAPLNLFLFIGAISLLADPLLIKFDENPNIAYMILALLGAAFAGGGILRAKATSTYIDRLILASLGVFGIVAVVFAALFLLDVNLNFLSFASPACFELKGQGAADKLTCFTGLGVFGLQSSWLFAVTLLILLLIVSLPGIRRHPWDKRSIYLAVCAAMLVLWMTITVAIWSLVVKAVGSLSGSGEEVESGAVLPAVKIINNGFEVATQTLVYGVFSLVVLAIAAGFVAVRRFQKRHELSEHDGYSSEIDKKYGRLILNPWLNLALFIAIAAFAFSAYVALAEFLVKAWSYTPEELGDGFWATIYINALAVDTWIKKGNDFSYLVITLIGFGILNFSGSIAAVIGVARDVTSYLTRSHRANPMAAASRSKYVYADEIQDRFRAVVSHVVAQEGAQNVGRITFMTHSQGTVVAAIGLKTLAQDLPVKPTLITMGSPVTHIYGHYFERNYQFTDASNAALERWINIYRRDDFVGTRVHGNGTQAQNFKVRPKGHSHYWSDETVWEIFKERGVF